MNPSIRDIEPTIRKGFRTKIDYIYYRAFRWQPFLDIGISSETVKYAPLRIVGIELFLSYNSQEVGPLPGFTRPFELHELGEGIEIRMRRDLYPTLDQELTEKKGSQQFFQIRGSLLIEAPGYDGFLEIPVDINYRIQL